MTTNIFEPINKYKVQIIFDNKIHLYPPVGVYESVNDMYEMICWVGNEAVKDWTETHEVLDAQKYINKKPQIRRDLSVRMGSRTLAYVNHLCLLNGILKKGLGRTILILKEKGLDSHIDSTKHGAELERLRLVFKPIKNFRDKVAAHTSFANPKKDTELMQFDSLLNLLPEPGSSVLGLNSFDRRNIKGFGPVSILPYKSDTEQYFGDWVKLYTSVLEPLKTHFTFVRGRIEIN